MRLASCNRLLLRGCTEESTTGAEAVSGTGIGVCTPFSSEPSGRRLVEVPFRLRALETLDGRIGPRAVRGISGASPAPTDPSLSPRRPPDSEMERPASLLFTRSRSGLDAAEDWPVSPFGNTAGSPPGHASWRGSSGWPKTWSPFAATGNGDAIRFGLASTLTG